MSEAEDFEFRLRMEREAQAPATPAPPDATAGERLLGTPLGSMALGASDLLTGPAQLGANIGSKLSSYLPDRFLGTPSGEGHHTVAADWINEHMAALNAASERGRAAQGRTGFDAWRAMGGVGAGTAASLGSKAVVTGVPYATSYLGKVAQGLGLGAFFGGTSADTSTTPQTNDQYLEGAKQRAELGTVAGAGMAAVVAPVARGAYNVLEPHLPGGTARVAQRTLVDAAGSARQAVQQELLKQQPPFTTAGEAAVPAGRAEFAGLQEKLKPYAPSSYLDMKHGENQGLIDAVEQIGKDPSGPQTLRDAIAARGGRANQLYGTAEKQVLTPDQALGTMFSRPSMKSVMSRAAELAKEKGDVFKIGQDLPERIVTSPIITASGQPITQTLPAETAQFPVKSLHYVKMAMDDLIKDPERFGIGANEANAIAGTQKQFIDWLSTKSPAYGLARETYEKMSGPVNRMEYGQVLKEKLQSALEDKLTPGGFAQARRNEVGTIKNALGVPRFRTEAEFLTPQEISALDKVTAQLQRNAAYKEQATAGLPSANRLVRETLDPDHVPNFFMRSVMIGHHILDRLQGHAETKALTKLAEVMQDPKVTGQLMQSADPAKQAMIKALMERGATVGASLSAPQLVGGGRR